MYAPGGAGFDGQVMLFHGDLNLAFLKEPDELQRVRGMFTSGLDYVDKKDQLSTGTLQFQGGYRQKTLREKLFNFFNGDAYCYRRHMRTLPSLSNFGAGNPVLLPYRDDFLTTTWPDFLRDPVSRHCLESFNVKQGLSAHRILVWTSYWRVHLGRERPPS